MEHAIRVQETIAQITHAECGLITGTTDAYERDLTIRRFKGETLPANLFGDPIPELYPSHLSFSVDPVKNTPDHEVVRGWSGKKSNVGSKNIWQTSMF